jgi:hypothetical protein
MDDLERMPALGAVKPRQKFVDVIHRAQRVAKAETGRDKVVRRAIFHLAK